jgi:hypothetical protein
MRYADALDWAVISMSLTSNGELRGVVSMGEFSAVRTSLAHSSGVANGAIDSGGLRAGVSGNVCCTELCRGRVHVVAERTLGLEESLYAR